MAGIRVESTVGMACDYYERLQVEEGKVEQLTAALQQANIRIGDLQSQLAAARTAGDGEVTP